MAKRLKKTCENEEERKGQPNTRAVPIGEGGEPSGPPEPPVLSRPHTVPCRAARVFPSRARTPSRAAP